MSIEGMSLDVVVNSAVSTQHIADIVVVDTINEF